LCELSTLNARKENVQRSTFNAKVRLLGPHRSSAYANLRFDVGRWVFGVFCQIGCVETTEGTASRRARLPNSFTEIPGSAEELAGAAAYDIDTYLTERALTT